MATRNTATRKHTGEHRQPLTLTQLKATVAAVTGERPSLVDELVEVTLAELRRAEPSALPAHVLAELNAA